ncbi:hypothetical protein T4E_7097 [Trichinella pseudospiralis]|uniref:Uncharacterized protein n=1 Tax=Trichinella pseudospiralis TaxID=6337 RepID=A0A0V0XP68_TRIPS|nr:hypothetical protein T4E_1871 [Trichinella pseudospiralis]KRX89689.1 hypothetical protein T4E_7097 [Trichinella pseudospiralis]
MGRSPFWVTGIDSRMTAIKAMLCLFEKFRLLFITSIQRTSRDPAKKEMPNNSVLPLFLVLLVTFHWTLCQCFVLPTFREFQDFFKRASKSPTDGNHCSHQCCPKFCLKKLQLLKLVRSDMVRTVVDMVQLMNTSQPASNEEHFNEAAVTKSITVDDETIIRVPARSPSVMEQSLGLLRPFFGNIDPWRAILYRDPPLLSVDLADGYSQENDMTKPTLSSDSFKDNFFKSTNHDNQLLDELEAEPVAERRPASLVIYRIIDQQVEEAERWRQCATILKIFVPNFADQKFIISTLGFDHIRRMGSQQGCHQVHGGNYDDRVIKSGEQVTGSFDQIVLDGRFVQLIAKLHLRVHVAVPSPVQVCQRADEAGQVSRLGDVFVGQRIRGNVAFVILIQVTETHRHREHDQAHEEHIVKHISGIGAYDRKRAELKQIQIGKCDFAEQGRRPSPQAGITLPVLGVGEGDNAEQHVRGEEAQIAGEGVAEAFRKPTPSEQVEQASKRVQDGVHGDPVGADEKVGVRPVDPRAHPQLVQRLHGEALGEKFPLVRADGHVESWQHISTVESFAACLLEQHPDLVLSLATAGKFAHQNTNSFPDVEIEALFAAVICNQPVQTSAENETSLNRIPLTNVQQSTFAGQGKRLVSVNDSQLTRTAVFPAVGEAQFTFAVRQL